MRKIHPRVKITTSARIDVQDAILKIVEFHELSYGEITSILAEELSSRAKCQIRNERHPDDADKPGDVE